jgi:anaerobic selenocysteine-containing dehydrogenase/ferredoxin-NADP reductase
MTAVEKKGYCTLCRSRCGTLNRVENDRLTEVRPDPEHPTGSAMCMKGRAAPEIVHSPHRLMFPMKRSSPKTDPDPGWIRIGWEEALATVAERLGAVRRESGAEAVAFAVTTPSGTPLSDSIDWIERFVRSFGSPNTVYATEVCNWHKDNAHAFTFGCGMQPADYAKADTIVLWGHNPANTWLAQASAIGQGRARGARMVVVDPRPTVLARQADVWLPVRPGTDAALALGIVRSLIESGRHDADFVRHWTDAGFLVRRDNGELLREHCLWPDASHNRPLVVDEADGHLRPSAAGMASPGVLEASGEARDANGKRITYDSVFRLLRRHVEGYTPETVERLTGVKPEALAAAADLMRGGQRMAYHAWTGVGQHTNATQTERCLATLYALNGSFDRVGGNRVREGASVRPVASLSLLPPAQRAKALGLAERPIGPPASGWVMASDMYRAILEKKPYPVRALMAFGTNLPISQGDTALATEALQQLEFHVHLDLFETPLARYADILLPVNSPWEHEGLRVGFEISDDAASLVQLRSQMVTPRGESRSDNDIVFALATRLGMSEAFFGGNLEAGWNHMLAPSGLTVEALRRSPGGKRVDIDVREMKYRIPHAGGAGQPRGFATPSGKVQLYSELLLAHGQPALASYLPSAEAERAGPRFPLLLSSAKNGYYCHSQHRSLASLRKRAPDPIAEIGTGLAARKGIVDGEWMRISTRMGMARFVARVTPGLADDVVVAEFGWWQSCPEIGRPAFATSGCLSSNFNSLVSSEDHDPVSGSTAMRSFRCDVERDPSTEERQRSWEGFRPFRITSLKQEADGVLGIHFEAIDGQLLPDFLPGQHVQIRLPFAGENISRAYSLTGAAAVPERRSYSIAVRHLRGKTAAGEQFEGQMSGHLHRSLTVGAMVELAAPSGSFVVPTTSPQPVILLAGGIGITPFINLLESLPDHSDLEVLLHYANLNSSTHAFKDRIRYHQRRLPRLRVFNHYAAPLADDRLGVDYDRADLITAAVVDAALIDRRARVYMCGPPPMMDAFRQGLVERGMPRFDIFSEVFRSPPAPMADDGRSFVVRFLKSRPEGIRWTPRQGALLPFAEAHGLKLANGCRVGQCESCTVAIVSGKVRHLHGSEPEDLATCLACQAVPTEDLALDA